MCDGKDSESAAKQWAERFLHDGSDVVPETVAAGVNRTSAMLESGGSRVLGSAMNFWMALADVCHTAALPGLQFSLAAKLFQEGATAVAERWADAGGVKTNITRQTKNDTEQYIRDVLPNRIAALSIDSPSHSRPYVALLKQCTVFIWAALDALAGDLRRDVLLANPSLFYELEPGGDATTRVGRILADSGRLGQILGGQLVKSEDIIQTYLEEKPLAGARKKILNTFANLCPGYKNDICRTLMDSRIVLLSERRHAIVHRGGKADGRYMRKSRDTTLSEGDMIIVTLADVRQYVEGAAEAAEVLIAASHDAAQRTGADGGDAVAPATSDDN